MSNNLDYKQKYLEYKIKYINKKKDIQTGGMQRKDGQSVDPTRVALQKEAWERKKRERTEKTASEEEEDSSRPRENTAGDHAYATKLQQQLDDPFDFLGITPQDLPPATTGTGQRQRRSQLQKPMRPIAAAVPAPPYLIPEELREKLGIIKTPHDEKTFIKAYKRFYQKNLGNTDRILDDLLRYGLDFREIKLNSQTLRLFINWFQSNVQPPQPHPPIADDIKMEQMDAIYREAGENLKKKIPEFEYTNPYTQQKIVINARIFLNEAVRNGGFESSDTIKRLYNRLFESPESPDIIKEDTYRDEKLAGILAQEEEEEEEEDEVFDYDYQNQVLNYDYDDDIPEL